MDETTTMRLNIGAGQTYIPGFVNIDIDSKADITLDLGEDRLPFDDNSVDLIFSYHTLEHVPNFLFALSEIHRVLKHGGLFLVGLPYVTLTEYHLINPYHCHNFNEHSFDFFDERKAKGSAAESNPILFSKAFHRFHYIGIFKFLPLPLRSWCRCHLFNVVRKIDYGLIAVKHPDKLTKPYNKQDVLRQFDECLRSRITYGTRGTDRHGETIYRTLKKISLWWRGHRTLRRRNISLWRGPRW